MADEPTFEKGDVVRLKSGSPSFVVIVPKIQDTGAVYCTRWSNSAKKAVEIAIQPFLLEKTNVVDSFPTE